MGSGDTGGDREQQRREEQIGGGIYEFSFGSNKFNVTVKHQWMSSYLTHRPKHDE